MLREYQNSDEQTILELNDNFVRDLSPMDAGRFAHLRKICSFLRVAERDGVVAGFIMAYTPGSAYDSPNYRWFEKNLESFLYIDRVVVSGEFQGLGVGREFYIAARDWAQGNDLKHLAAEINVEPPNPGSLRFHERMGFGELGTREYGPEKVVSLQCLMISSSAH